MTATGSLGTCGNRLRRALAGGTLALLAVVGSGFDPGLGPLRAPGGGAAQAQGLFSPAIRVNDSVITGYELRQRALFYRFISAPGGLEELARKQLIDERLQLQAARAMGVEIADEAVAAGIAEFAARGNLSAEEFLARAAQAGVARQTVEAFVRAGLAWREVVGQRFAARVQVSEEEIDRALALASSRDSVQVLVSELILPARTPEEAEQARALAAEVSRITSFEDFAEAARRYSAASSRTVGGRLEWLPLANLPPAIAGQILTLAPGRVTDPIPIPNAIALFQLRALRETGLPPERIAAIDYARFLIPGGRTERTLAEAARIDAETDGCDDLYGIAKGLPPERLLRETRPPEDIPADIGLELARLDPGEISTALTVPTADGGSALVVLMLCGRTPRLDTDVNREQLAQILRNQRIASQGEGYLAALRADAVIVDLTR